jgi:hypothetical protein
MKFVAPEQAPDTPELIENTPFWPDLNLADFRSVMRTDGTVTGPRLRQVVLTAISEVNAELFDFRSGVLPRWPSSRRRSWPGKARLFTTTATRCGAGRGRC